jgi:hypothetical protein
MENFGFKGCREKSVPEKRTQSNTASDLNLDGGAMVAVVQPTDTAKQFFLTGLC